MTQTVEEFIEHHGTKGMKWGVRKRPKSSDYKKTEPLRKKRAKELSNKQLKAINERRNLEKSFKQLNPTPVKKALKVPGEAEKLWKTGALAAAGGAAAVKGVQYLNSPAGRAMVKLTIEKLKEPIVKQLSKHGEEAVQLALKFN